MEFEDGTIVVGASSVNFGSLYVSRGGLYKLHVSTMGSFPWHMNVVTLPPAGQPMVDAPGMPGGMYYTPPDAGATAPGSAVGASTPVATVPVTAPPVPFLPRPRRRRLRSPS